MIANLLLQLCYTGIQQLSEIIGGHWLGGCPKIDKVVNMSCQKSVWPSSSTILL
jgi:hypothetical protein